MRRWCVGLEVAKLLLLFRVQPSLSAFFSSGSWVLRFLFGIGRSLAKSRRRLGMNRRDFFS